MAGIFNAARFGQAGEENIVGKDVLGGYFLEELEGVIGEGEVRVEAQKAVSDESIAVEAKF